MPAATHSNRRFQPETAFDTLPQTAAMAMSSVKTPKEYQRIVEPLETDEIKRLLKAIEGKAPSALRNRAIILTLLDCGLRGFRR